MRVHCSKICIKYHVLGEIILNLEQLNYVLEIEKTRSINRAANNLFISQSAMSLAIQNLEKELGHPIFTRTNRGVETTPFGRTFIRFITPIQMQIQQIEMLFVQGKQHHTMTFTLANDCYQVANEVFAKLFNKYASIGIKMNLLEGYGDEARSHVASRLAEVGVTRLWNCYKKIELQQFRMLALTFHAVYETGLAVIIGPKNGLYHQDIKYVTPEMLEPYPILKYGYLETGPFKDIIERIGLRYSNSTIVTSSRSVMQEMINRTEAYSITADTNAIYTAEELPHNRRSLPLRGTDIRAEIGWLSRRNEALSPIANEFTQLLEQRFV